MGKYMHSKLIVLLLIFGLGVGIMTCGGGGGGPSGSRTPPGIANAGGPYYVNCSENITIDGRGSIGDIQSWNWFFRRLDEGGVSIIPVIVSGIGGSTPTVRYECTGLPRNSSRILKITLTVRDAQGKQAVDETEITVTRPGYGSQGIWE